MNNMDKENSKSWERPWTTEEMRQHSSNWNLAGDAGLLNHLQEFSQNLLSRTHTTEVALDKLMEDMKSTSTNVQNVTNLFLSLANTQFVENRVYDDDEKETPPEEKKDEVKNIKPNEEQESEVYKNVKKALEMGMSLLDTHFDSVEVPASDSEEEESSASIGRLILKPKNPYISRPLPYLIGSQEFMDDDNVGLGDVSSDNEESPDQNILQSSGSDEDIDHDDIMITPKKQTLSSSDMENSEPESDRSESIVKQKKMRGNSSIGFVGKETEEERDMFGQESPPEADVMAVGKSGLPRAFSDELASKLVTNKSLAPSQDKDNLFGASSETEDDTGLFGKTSRSFSDKQGLFDDINDWQNTSDSLWNNKETEKAVDSSSSKPPRSDQLFGSDNFDDSFQNDNIFNSSKQNLNSSIESNQVSTSTPQSVTSDVGKSEFLKNKVIEENSAKKIKVPTSLFDKDDLEDDDLFSAPSTVTSAAPSFDVSRKKVLSHVVDELNDGKLFGDISPVVQPNLSVDNRSFIVERSTSQQESSSGIANTVDDILPKEVENASQEQHGEADEKSLTFDSKLFQGTSTKIQNDVINKSSLFREEKNSDSLFDKPKNQDQSRPIVGGNISGAKLFPTLKTKSKKTVSLFDDSDSGEDELLFSSTSSTSSRSRRSQGSADILSSVGEKVLSRKGLFEDSVLFGSESKEEPEVDIFKPQGDSKNKSESLPKKSSFDKNVLLDANAKVSSIFDNIDDDVDDIFALPKSSLGGGALEGDTYFQNSSKKSLLFTEDYSNSHDVKLFEENQNSSVGSEDPTTDSSKNKSQSLNPSLNLQDSLKNTESLFEQSVQEVKTIPGQDINNSTESDDVIVDTRKSTESRDVQNVERAVATSNTSHLFKDSEKQLEVSSSVESDNVSGPHKNSKTVVSPASGNIDSNSNNFIDVKKINVNKLPSVKAEPPRSLNIRKTTDVMFESPSNDDDDDLFGSLPTNKTSFKNENLVPDVPDKSAASSSSFSKLLEGFNSNSDIKSPVNSRSSFEEKKKLVTDNQRNSEQNAEIGGKVPSSDASVSRASSSSPRKIFIDPRALLPGAKPPPVQSTSNGAVGFDKPAENSSILHSAAKERVKIQVKRRPQTRKARQEALRASYIENNDLEGTKSSNVSNHESDGFQDKVSVGDNKIIENNVDVNKIFSETIGKSTDDSQAIVNSTKSILVEEKSELSQTDKSESYRNFLSDCVSSNSNPLSPLTDEEDLFAVPHELPGDDSSSKEITNSTKNLFGGAPVLSPVNDILESAASISIFENVDDDDFLSNQKPLSEQCVIESDSKSEILKDNKIKTSNDLFFSDDVQNASENSFQNAPVLSKSMDNRLFDDDLGHTKGIFDKAIDLEDDDNLFFSGKNKIKENKPGSSPEQRKPDHSKSFTDITTPELSLFPANSPHSDISETSKSLDIAAENNILRNPENKLPVTNKTYKEDEGLQNKQSNIFHKEDSEDLFFQSSKSKPSGDNSSSTNLEKNKPHVGSLFGDDSTETEDLFGSSSINVSKKYVTSSNSLFSNSKVRGAKESLFDDCDDDIFTVKSSKTQEQSVPSPFGEGSTCDKEPDELFSTKITSSKLQSSKPISGQKIPTKEPSFEDPLMAMKK